MRSCLTLLALSTMLAPATAGARRLLEIPVAALVDGLTGVIAIAAGGQHMCVLLAASGLRCWASRSYA